MPWRTPDSFATIGRCILWHAGGNALGHIVPKKSVATATACLSSGRCAAEGAARATAAAVIAAITSTRIAAIHANVVPALSEAEASLAAAPNALAPSGAFARGASDGAPHWARGCGVGGKVNGPPCH